MRRRSGFALWWTLSVALLWSGCQTDPPSDAEQTAIRFYKAVWVQGDLQQAAALLQDPKKAKDLEWRVAETDRKSTRLNSSHVKSSYAVFCLKKKRNATNR